MYSKFDSLLAACGQNVENGLDQQALMQRHYPAQAQPLPQQPKLYKSEQKSCAQCGVTKTPQWREGPLGPKTLCNACGVKRVRQMKSSGQGSSKRKMSRTQTPSSLLDPEDNADVDYQHTLRQTKTARKVATRCITRAEELKMSDQQSLTRRNSGAAEPDLLAKLHQPHSDSDEATSMVHSDSPEEVCWAPQRVNYQPPASPHQVSAIVGTDCAAAVNLLSMSAKDRPPPPNAIGILEDRQLKQAFGGSFQGNEALAITTFQNSLQHFPDFQQTQQFIVHSLQFMAPEKQQEWLAVSSQMGTVLQQSADADAAVLDIAKVLAYKQAEATEARKRAYEYTKAMQPYMLHFQQECMANNFKRGRSDGFTVFSHTS